MDPQIIDHYNEMPSEVNVINKMNEELSEIQKENDNMKNELDNMKQELDKYLKVMNKFKMPRIKVNSVEEYKEFETKLEEFGEFIDSEMDDQTTRSFMHSHLRNYGHIEDTNAILYNPNLVILIDKLDGLTNRLNREWCECRILTSVEMFIKTEGNIHHGEEVKLSDIIVGINDNDDNEQLPSTYCELSRLNRPTWTGPIDITEQQGHNILNIPYYNCEKCGKLDDYGAVWHHTLPEFYGNSLLCINCQDD
jgi:hypothetical protein